MANSSGLDGADTIQSFDESEVLTDIGFYKTLFRLYWNSRKICIPAIVTEKASEEEEDKGKITVRPLVNLSKCTKDGRKGIQRADVKVWPIQMRSGGFKITSPVFVGDTGYLVSGDRYYDNIVKKNANPIKEDVEDVSDSPNEGPQDLEAFDSNEWEYGFFIPSSWVVDDIADDLKDKFVFGNVQDGDKSAYISIDNNGDIVIHGHSVTFESKEPIKIIKFWGNVVNENKDSLDHFATDLSDRFSIVSAKDSNIKIKCEGNTIEIGAYYI